MKNRVYKKIDPAKLVAARGERKQSQVAKTLGIDRQRLWDYESGRCQPSVHILIALSDLYNHPLESFLTEESSDLTETS